MTVTLPVGAVESFTVTVALPPSGAVSVTGGVTTSVLAVTLSIVAMRIGSDWAS